MFVRDETSHTKILGGYERDKSPIFMCRTQFNYFGCNEMIPGKLTRGSCFIVWSECSYRFGSFLHRYDVLVIKN